MDAMLIFKIVRAEEWGAVRDEYAGSAKDRADGFLHLSTAEQLPGTLARYYANERDLLLIAVESGKLGEALKFEPSTGGALYPHLYGPLPMSAAAWVRPIMRNARCEFVLPVEE